MLAASGEPSAGVSDGYLCMPEEELRRIADRAGFEGRLQDLHRLGFVDRRRQVHRPLEGAVAIARAFAAAQPESVLTYIEDDEEGLRARGYGPGERYAHDLVREYQPATPWRVSGLGSAGDRDAAEGDRPASDARDAGGLPGNRCGAGLTSRRLLRTLDGH